MLKAPLRNFTHYGYIFLTPIKSWGRRGWHSGLDFNKGKPNQDLGEPIFALGKGVVEYIKESVFDGWGKMIVVRHTFFDENNLERTVWARYVHLQEIFVKFGDEVYFETIIGSCGRTGTKYPHLHLDVMKVNPRGNYNQYTWGMSRDKVARIYCDIEFMMKYWNYEKLPSISEWAKEGWNWARERGLNEGIIPKEIMKMDKITTKKLEELFIEFGGFKEPKGEISWERFFTGAERIYKKIE